MQVKVMEKVPICVHNKKEEKGRWQAIIMVRRGGERDSVQKMPSGITMSAAVGKA